MQFWLKAAAEEEQNVKSGIPRSAFRETVKLFAMNDIWRIVLRELTQAERAVLASAEPIAFAQP